MKPVPERVRDAVTRTVGFRARIVLVVFATTTVFALFVVARSTDYLREAYSRGATEQAVALARTFDAELAPAELRDRAALLRRLDRMKAGNPTIRKLSLYVVGPDGRGRRIASTAREDIGLPVAAHDVAPIRTGRRRTEELHEGGHIVELNFPLRGGRARPFAAVGLYFDVGAADASFAQRRRRLLLVGLAAAVAAAALVALVLGLFVFRPIAKLRAATQRLRAGDLSGRLNWKRSDELGALARDVDQMASAVEERERFAALALKDPLTGLANHRHFDSALEAELKLAAAEGTNVALGLLDLDHFKQINDVHGHPFGDEVLRRSVRSRDLVARLGGEEFAVILPGCDDAVAVEVVEKARGALAGISAGDRMLSASAGVAAFPQDAHNRTTLLEFADGALYWAKRSGRDMTRRYDPTHVVTPSRGDEEAEIATLLEDPSGVGTVFQPLVELSSGAIAGYEALARFAPWAAPRGPLAWFARAQRFGQRERMEVKALRSALERRGRPPGTFLSLNLSAPALTSTAIRDVLPEDLSGIMVEITEETIVAGGATIAAAINRLRGRGARIAVDDAGAGFATLAQLATLRPDVIKLDASLVGGVHADPARAAVIASLVTFAEHTAARFCAKSIEGLDELRVVAKAGVAYGQGHALAPPADAWAPVSADALAALAEVRRTRDAAAAALGRPAEKAPA